jgi:hypothetical protein
MPVRRFHSVAEMTAPPPLPPLTSETLRCAFDLMELAWRLHPVRFPPGVRKFRSLEEAHRSRAAWEKTAPR